MTAITGPGQQGKSAGNKIPSGYEAGQLQQFTPEQMQLFKQLFAHLGPDSFLSKIAGGDQSAFAEMEAPALRQFSEEQGNIASRFSGMGQGGRKSSGFKNTMNTAASNFAQDLAGKRNEKQMSAIEQLMQMSNMMMGQKPYENFLTKKDQGQGLGGWGGAAGGILGGIGGFLSPMPGGAMAGAKLGYGIGSGFD